GPRTAVREQAAPLGPGAPDRRKRPRTRPASPGPRHSRRDRPRRRCRHDRVRPVRRLVPAPCRERSRSRIPRPGAYRTGPSVRRVSLTDALLEPILRGSGSARPLITFYDDATGERIELSGVTTANWVAKTANL